MDEEKQNPFGTYWQEPMPWTYLEQRERFKLFERGIVRYDTSNKKDKTFSFQPRDMSDMVSDFFEDGHINLYRLKHHADRWILWSVTEGRIRMSRTKQLWIFQGTSADILKLKFGENHWELVCSDETFSILAEITEVCNQLYSEIERKLVNYKSKCNGSVRNIQLNFSNMPEMVQFQSYRTYAHKKQNSRWQYQPLKKGGNEGLEKANKSTPNPKHSVHRILSDYHLWLPTVRNYTFNGFSFKK